MATIHLTDDEAGWLYDLVDDAIAAAVCGQFALPEYPKGSCGFIDGISEKLRAVAIEQGGNLRCASCGKEILAPRPGQRTCSDACRQRLSRANRAMVKKAREQALKAARS